MTRSFTAGRREVATLRLAAQAIQAPEARSAGASAGTAAAGTALTDTALTGTALTDTALTTAVAATVRRLLAVQAQDFAGAKWSVGLRTPGSTDASIEASLAAGEIVRSWPMRGTLHFVPPEDLGWMLSLTADRIIRSAAGRHRDLELTEPQFEHARDVAVEHLSGGRALGRDDLFARFEAAGISVTGQRGIHLLQRLSLWRVVVFGPVRGTQQTFTLLDEWVTHPRRLDRDEALGEFAARYFWGHGPATVRDFAWWSSLTLADARRGLDIARPLLDEIDVDGTSYFLQRDAAPATRRSVHALPGFDEFLLGYHDRSAALAPQHSELVVPGKNGLFHPTIVVGGEVVGTWRRTTTAKTVTVEPRPFSSLSARDSALFASAAARYARFVGRAVSPG